ncbi:MAG: DEAD/DEAH box helicase [Desulfovibrionaceae bacterium]|nr:DEAD/DEAH box helicase [Desulfovibrionaceae bacterium]
MNPIQDYVAALLASERLGPQVVHHRFLPGAEARFAAAARPWPAALQDLLKAKGLGRLYSHQARAVDLVRSGRHVVLATPTASGKTLAYALPIIEQCLADPGSRALYLSPLKALAQDQLRAFSELVAPLEDRAPSAAVYDGDTSDHRRRKIRNDPPNLVLTNPEMVHLSLLPHHGAWAGLFAGLTHVVVDEVHTYRGLLGSHMAMVLRRLLRVCGHYGSSPTLVFCSATVGNPAELCGLLSGLEVVALTESGAARSGRHMVFVNPLEGAARAAIQLLQAALARELRTIVYTQSRKLTELIAMWARQRSGPYAGRISAYRAGFLPEERRDIEARLASGELLAVVSTSALELGIDIGGLDLCLLVGYPGTVMAAMQRGGRVGRGPRDSAVALVAQEDALDQYFMRHPEDFFSRPPEDAVLNPHNPVVMARHLVCAAAELSLKLNGPLLAEPQVRDRALQMAAQGELLMSEDGLELFSLRKRPHRDLDLRGAGKSLRIRTVGPDPGREAAEGEEIGTIDGHRAFRETHPGAVYLHRGRTWLVRDLDLAAGEVRARQARLGYYTRVRGNKQTEILETVSGQTVFGTRVFFGRLRVTERVTGFEKRAVRGGRCLGVSPLDLPPLVFETEGLWFEVPDRVRRLTEQNCLHFMGAIHALEHAAIGILPLLVMTDRNDLGGVSTPLHPQVGTAAVFVYDGAPGGAGLSRQAYLKAAELLEVTLKAVRECPCELGCPSCVHSPKCGSGNRPMDKAGAVFVLEQILGSVPERDQGPVIARPKEPEPVEGPGPARFAVLDLETRRSAQEVGGWNRADLMGLSVAVVYDSTSGAFSDFGQDRVDELAARLEGFDLVIGFNLLRFDYSVLSGLSAYDFASLPTLDLLASIHSRLGYRISLDNLARASLGRGKTADGLKALEWWRQGRLDLITEYCRQDVAATRDLYLFGRDNGFVLFTAKSGQRARVPVDW